MSKTLRIAGWMMVWAGGLVLAFLAYQLFGTDLLNARAQDRAEARLEERFEEVRAELPPVASTAPTPTTPTAPATTSSTLPEVELYEEPAAPEGEPFGMIRIPEIGLADVLFAGVDRETLKKGPGHMPWTPLPGQPGNAVISGHRTTYGQPFFSLDELEPGDEIIVETALGEHVYAVRQTIIVLPHDVWVTDPRAGAWLTLTTCHPRFSAAERMIVFAELVEGPNLEYVEAHHQAGLEDVS
ncbi:MAG: class E sortase [Acidimicrobiia bacterium]